MRKDRIIMHIAQGSVKKFKSPSRLSVLFSRKSFSIYNNVMNRTKNDNTILVEGNRFS